jgi:hypothetical protein
MNNKSERTWREAAWVSLKILSRNLLDVTNKSRKILRVFCWFPGRYLNTKRHEHEAGFLFIPLRRVKKVKG